MAAMAMTTADPSEAKNYQAEMERLGIDEQRLTRELNAAGGTGSQTRAEWIELDDFRKALPAKSVFIDIIRFDPIDLNKKGSKRDFALPASYAACITHGIGGGDPTSLSIGRCPVCGRLALASS